MQHLTLILLLALVTNRGYCQKLSPQAEKVRMAYEAVMKQPHAPILQIRYIQAFPSTQLEFIDIFNAHNADELSATGADYVKKFRKLGYDYPDSVLPKAISIGKNMPTWSAGAVDELQKTIYYLTEKDPQLFVNTVRELKKEEQTTLAQFLIMGPYNARNKNYDVLLDIFDKTGDKKLYKIFSGTKIIADETESK